MGTRNLTIVVLDGEYKVAQYCQWDGYPEGQGLNILSFLNKGFNKEIFKEKTKQITEIDNEKLKSLWIECGADPESAWVSFDVSDKFKNKYPWLHRDFGGEIVRKIQESENSFSVKNSLSFAGNSSCEWAYVIDLDKDTFEVYKNNYTPLTKEDRFYFLQNENDDYEKPAKLIVSYSLNALPTEKEFHEYFYQKREEEDSEEN